MAGGTRPNAYLELGRVIGVNQRRYSIDVVTESGRILKDVPFLSPYVRANAQGQGVYMMPETNSFTLVIKMVSQSSQGLFGSEAFCYGFFSPIDNTGSFDGKREPLNPGDYAVKTSAGNKMLLTTDGVIWIYASDLAQMRLFPASGNIKDSAGLDHLLQILIENLEFRTSGGNLEWRVNKKAGKTNLHYEIKNRPLLEHNPDIWVGNIGSQGVLGDDRYFHTWDRYNTSAEGESKVLRVSFKEKIDGETLIKRFDEEEREVLHSFETPRGDRERTTFNPDSGEPYMEQEEGAEGNLRRTVYNGNGVKQHEIDLKSTGEITETHYVGGSPVWQFVRNADGSSERIHFAGGSPTWKESIGSDGSTQILVPGGGDKARVTISPSGVLEIEADQDLTIRSKSANITVESLAGNVTVESAAAQVLVKAAAKIIAQSPLVEVGEGSLKKVLLETAAQLFNEHTHDFIDSRGDSGTTLPPSQKMAEGDHWSSKVSAAQ